MSTAVASPALGLSLGGALAAAVCLALAEWWHLQHANLAVWTTHMVTAQYPFTAFQKGSNAFWAGVWASSLDWSS